MADPILGDLPVHNLKCQECGHRETFEVKKNLFLPEYPKHCGKLMLPDNG